MKRTEKAQPVDTLVGRRVRMLRVSRGLSQTDIGRRLGITFQQIQKYENGANRISASKLHEIAQILGVEVGHLFADADMADNLAADLDPPRRVDLLVADALAKLPDGRVKEQLADLILALAGKEPVTVGATDLTSPTERQ